MNGNAILASSIHVKTIEILKMVDISRVRTSLLVASVLLGCVAVSSAAEPTSLQLIVMDPLAAPLSCPCVEGYAQREYQSLAAHLKAKLDRNVNVTFSESLRKALKDTGGRADLIIGKDSVVRADAAAAKIKIATVALLADKTGSTQQHGLIVVRGDDVAQMPSDLAGYDVIFGPAECEEKHAAAIELLKRSGISIPTKLTIDQACSDGACKVIEFGDKRKVAAVISSYAAPLLEGCGTINKGDLRVVGRTEPVPFITAFVNGSLPTADRKAIQNVLFSVVESPELCGQLETLIGFVEPVKKKSSASR